MKICLYCSRQCLYFVYDNFYMVCITYLDYSLLYILFLTLSLASIIYLYYIIHFTFFSLKKKSLLTGVYGNVGHNILHKEEKNRRRNTSLSYDPKEEKFLLYCPLYTNYLGYYTKTTWPRGLSTESVTEDKV